MQTTRLVESAARDFAGAAAERLLKDELFWALVKRNYLTVDQLEPGRIRVSAKTHIGRAASHTSTIEIIEKIPGETDALVGQATLGAFRVERLGAPSGPPGRLLALLVHQFVGALTAYASSGREGAYVRRTEVGSLIGGRIRLVDSIRLRARGLRHRIAFDRSQMAFDTPLNRALLATIRQVERIATEIPLLAGDRDRARALAMVFEDCLDGRFLTTQTSEFLANLDLAQKDPFGHRGREASALATVVLDRVSFSDLSSRDPLLPRAWFLDLGRLFEDVITKELRRLLAPEHRVEEGSKMLQPMFGQVVDRYRADPDLIVKAGTTIEAVGDVKHKPWTGVADPADLYQLLAHTATYKGADCFLAYPHVSYEVVDLGTNPLGGTSALFAVDVKDVRGSLERAMAELGLTGMAA